jgi:hypothetical protein
MKVVGLFLDRPATTKSMDRITAIGLFLLFAIFARFTYQEVHSLVGGAHKSDPSVDYARMHCSPRQS